MRTPLALVAVVAMVVAACGGATSPSPTVAAPTAATPTVAATPAATPEAPTDAPVASPTEQPTAGGDASVTVADSELGQILVDGEGRTLYLFTPDEAGEPTCYDDCAAIWPPLLAEGEPVAGEGVTAELSTATRTDGGEQVKAGTWPLYYFANDQAPGDTNGQGLNGVWFVVSPSGEAIR